MSISYFNNISTQETLSRHEMLAWFNDILKTRFEKIEHLHTGAAYCQLIDILFEDAVSMEDVRIDATTDQEYRHNWTLLQAAFAKIALQDTIPVDQLVTGDYETNFEFARGFKRFFDANYGGQEYDAVDARGGREFTYVSAPQQELKPRLSPRRRS